MKFAREEGPVFRRFAGGARWSASLFVMSTLGRDDGTAVLSWSSASLSTDGGSERSDDAGESAIVAVMLQWICLADVVDMFSRD